jgi:ABC-type branched-subunit amino acid transport system ATPase component
MDLGEIIARGTAREIQTNRQVIEAYLGKGEVAGVRRRA